MCDKICVEYTKIYVCPWEKYCLHVLNTTLFSPSFYTLFENAVYMKGHIHEIEN